MKQRKPFMERRRKLFIWIAALAAASPLVVLATCTVGSAAIPFDKVWEETVRHVKGLDPLAQSDSLILFGIRLPRAILSYLVGAGLGLCGACMQGVFQNPMADPHLLGVSSGAAFGATIGMLLGISASVAGLGLTTVLAFAGGIFAVLAVHMLSIGHGRVSPGRLLLAGIAMTSLLSAAISGMMIFRRDKMDKIVQWTMGSFTSASWEKVTAGVLMILPLCLLLSFAGRTLNALSLGDESAQSLGIPVEGTRRIILALSTLCTAAAVSLSGIIGFVGLVVPHIARMLLGGDYRTLLPVSFFAGGLFLTLMDTLARTLAAPLELPVGVITALIGGIFFLAIMRKTRHNTF